MLEFERYGIEGRRLPLTALEALATLEAVQTIRPADRAQTRGPAPTE